MDDNALKTRRYNKQFKSVGFSNFNWHVCRPPGHVGNVYKNKENDIKHVPFWRSFKLHACATCFRWSKLELAGGIWTTRRNSETASVEADQHILLTDAFKRADRELESKIHDLFTA